MELAQQTGVMQYLLPDVYATHGFDQKSQYHALLLGDHIMQVLRLTAQQTDDPDVRIAALLHDIGKPPAQWFDEKGLGHFYQNDKGEGLDHEQVGADMTRKALRDLRVPDDQIQRIEHLVRSHMFPPFSSAAGARKFLNRYGDDHADDLMKLRWADSGGKDSGNPQDGSVDLMSQHIQHVREAREPTNLKALAINGHDLIQAGMTPGSQMGHVLNWLMEQVLENPALNDRETLLAMVAQGMPEAPESPPNATGEGTVSKTANILDDIHDALDPDVFIHPDAPDPDVHPEIRKWVKRTVYKIMLAKGWPDPAKYLSLVLTGSLTTYQWSEESDFDVSLWVDTKQFPEWVRAELIGIMIEHAEGLVVPGTTHPLQAFVVDTNRYEKTDLYKPGMRSGYDLDKGAWLVMPEKTRTIDVYKTYPALITYVKEVEDKFRLLLRYNHYALKVCWDNLHRRRFQDMKMDKGDYAESNIAYKWLSHVGLFPLIAAATGEHIAKVEDE
jgi:putative nucleotidyltransferase with HDIG domain